MKPERTYDCDTRPYWTKLEEEDPTRKWGRFVHHGRAYRIEDPATPRPWLNYLVNDQFGAVISNRGQGFQWLFSTLFRITKYEHPIDYLPREFDAGRDAWLIEPGKKPIHFFQHAEELICEHSPFASVFRGRVGDWEMSVEFTVPLDWPMEWMRWTIRNASGQKKTLAIRFAQTWSVATFGIHTAEEGIPYVSTPGTNFSAWPDADGWRAKVDDPALPCQVHAFLIGSGAAPEHLHRIESRRRDGRLFVFHEPVLRVEGEWGPGEKRVVFVASGAAPSADAAESAVAQARDPEGFERALRARRRRVGALQRQATCRLPREDEDVERFLNVWFKHQLHLTFHFCRSGHSGYRDTLQDLWGYTLMDPAAARAKLLRTLSHLRADGTAPRNFSNYPRGTHDHRRFMDSGSWIAEALADYVAETGDAAILQEEIPFLDGGSGSVLEHAWRAGQALFRMRGQYGACLVGDGDWNDALEGISRDGDAVSMWLTIALYHSHRRFAELLAYVGETEKHSILREQMDELRRVINGPGWDGEWFVYGYTGSGKPIGSQRNREGRIHANAQTWAVFSGAAEPNHAQLAMHSLDRYLQTPLGAALLAPPYVEEAAEVGRIARLEPGTFENGAVYIHAVAFQVRAYLALGRREDAFRTLKAVLPTNPKNPDARRTSEPYATGNYYCGPGHARFGQNFFTWFTGNPAWFLRIGFDQMLGVRAGFEGLEITPNPPAHWTSYDVNRVYRGCRYHIQFVRRDGVPTRIWLDGRPVEGSRLPIVRASHARVRVEYSLP